MITDLATALEKSEILFDEEDIDDIIDEHLVNGRVVERLRI